MADDLVISEGTQATGSAGTTFQDIYEDVINRLHKDTDDTNLVTRVKGYVNDNYKQIANKYDWPWLYNTATIVTIAKYDTGTVTVTNGSTTVTGSGTTFTSGMVGRKFKATGFDEIYTISSFTSTTVIVLDNEYNGTTDTEASYEIFQDLESLPSDCDRIVSLQQHRHPKKLELIGLREMRRIVPAPSLKDSDPTKYAYYENDSSGYQQILLWTPPYRQIVLNCEYKLLITDLAADDDPPLIPEQYRQILKWMTIADCLGLENDDDRSTYYEKKANYLLNDMVARYTTTDDYKQMVPERRRVRAFSKQALANKYDLGNIFDRM
jgi:hypothetical protein